VRDALREDLGGAILDGPNDAAQHAAGDTPPRAIRHPRLPFAGLLAFDLTRAPGADGEARTLGSAPPAGAGPRKAPQDGCVCIEQNDLTATSLLCECREVDRGLREGSRVRS
jgi:hypothetical protein